MSARKFFPIIRTIYAKEIKLIDAKIEASKAAYKSGDKQTAYDLLKEVVKLDGTCIAERGQMGTIAVELKKEAEQKLSASTTNKPKRGS